MPQIPGTPKPQPAQRVHIETYESVNGSYAKRLAEAKKSATKNDKEA